MSDLISRQDAANTVARWILEDDILPLPEDYSYSLAESILNQVPSADRPKGKWYTNKFRYDCTCSNCGCSVYHKDALNFCPNCGARMVGDTE